MYSENSGVKFNDMLTIRKYILELLAIRADIIIDVFYRRDCLCVRSVQYERHHVDTLVIDRRCELNHWYYVLYVTATAGDDYCLTLLSTLIDYCYYNEYNAIQYKYNTVPAWSIKQIGYELQSLYDIRRRKIEILNRGRVKASI